MFVETRDVRVAPSDHESNQMDDSVVDWLDSLPGWSLNLGAGSSLRRPEQCVELEYSIFRNTSVVGDAHRLPFKDGTFEAVVSYNTFEHLADPGAAAGELLRVLKPGGELRLQTAFLQPLHEAPAHFYGATEYGIHRWFRRFDIEDCFVPNNMSPSYAIAWLSSALLWHVDVEQGPESRVRVGESRLSDWKAFWYLRFRPYESGGVVDAVQSLSQPAQKQIAFGHELHAIAPPYDAEPASRATTRSDLVQLLRCPNCSSPDLTRRENRIGCQQCERTFPVIDGVPVMLRDQHPVSVMPIDHESNPISEPVLEWLDSLPGWSLNLGAGATARRPRRCVELEYAIFRNTSLVGDAHDLPFQDGVFDAVISYNTFEHLAEPSLAAAELLRVLKPGGKVVVQSAFLQPLHEEPWHFYNATEFGLRNWFSAFEIEGCFVPPEMGPANTLGWLADHVLYHIRSSQGPEVAKLAESLRLSQFARFWEVPSTRHGFLKYIFDQMPDRSSHFSAGFEIRARRPQF
jgi:ubiquinone/menaquinone biosynthesis C-methylase UbiE/uncharacterized protein YbaR (Trm112 family)